MDDPDIRLHVKVKNARILRAMEASGIKTPAELARRSGISKTMTGKLVNFQTRPVGRNGEWVSVAIAISAALNRQPSDLWPEYLQQIDLVKNTVDIDMTAAQFEKVAGGEQDIIRRDAIKFLMSRLPPRSAKVIEMRYGLNGYGQHDLKEIGEELGVTGARVREIEMHALRKLGRAARSEEMKNPLEDE